MYEDETYAIIMARMENRVRQNYPDIDYREGSMIFNALAPAAMELAIMYNELDNIFKEQFVQTATRDSLLKLCEQVGLDIGQFSATYCTVRAQFDAEIEVGSRWNCDLYNYTVTEFIDIIDDRWEYYMQCETAGRAPNGTVGELTPINYVNNDLKNANIIGIVATAQDEWTDDDIRSAYIEHVNNYAIDGNVAQYKKWSREYAGIGKYKVFPLWNGANTVKVSILDEDSLPCTEDFIAEFQAYLDPGTTGMGDGVAPIGAFVTVGTATTKTINVSAEVSVQEDYDSETVMSMLSESLSVYFRDISYVKSTVSYMNVGAVLSDVAGVEFINNLKVNNSTANISIASEEVPMLGTTTWTLVTE